MSAIADICTTVAESHTAPAQIASIVIPSRDRLGALERGLTSYITHCKDYGRTNNFIVIDDSTHRDIRQASREMLTLLGKRHGAAVRYGDPDTKRQFAKKLIDYSGIPEGVINFALFDTEGCNITTAGTNRNALLLDTIGDLILSADDDTICQIAAPQGLEDTLTLRFGIPSPPETWLYPDRNTLLRSITFIDTDLLAAHEQTLGKSLDDCATLFGHVSEECYMGQIRAACGHVVVTLNGIVGDCGASQPVSLFLPEQSFQRLTQSEAHYHALCLSREIFRFVTSTVITDRYNYMMSTCFGLDNRGLVPPFLPVGRGQDGIFGRVLGKCFEGSYAARLPWSIFHALVEKRSFMPDDLVKDVGSESLAGMFGQLISMFKYSEGQIDGAEQLRRLGRYLEEIARLPALEFEEVIRSNSRITGCATIAQIEEHVHHFGTFAPAWAYDVERYLVAYRQAQAQQGSWAPNDLLSGRSLEDAQALAQRLVLKFGQLLYWWPAMVAASRELRAQGHRITLQV